MAGVVAGLVFVSSLDRLIDSPSRSAIPYDVGIADVTVEDLEGEVLDSPLVGDVSITTSAPLSIEGIEVDGHAVEDLRGLARHRHPGRAGCRGRPDEIALGLRIAVTSTWRSATPSPRGRADGEERELAVVGVAVVPTFNGEELGTNALMTPEGLEANATASPFTGAAVVVAPGEDVDELHRSSWRRASRRTPRRPRWPCRTSSSSGGSRRAWRRSWAPSPSWRWRTRLVVAVRRRRRDLAVMRAMGFTRRQTAVAVVVMALAIVAIGVVVGVPVGMAIGATVWRATASGAFVLSDAYFRWALLLLPVLGAVVIALVAATIPARQAAAQSAAEGLRAE